MLSWILYNMLFSSRLWYTETGKHTGNLLGYPPTKKVVAWMGATEFTCQNGKILKVWELGDIKTLEEQLTSVVEMDEV